MSVLCHVATTQNQFVWAIPDWAAVPAQHTCDQSQLWDLNPGPVFTLWCINTAAPYQSFCACMTYVSANESSDSVYLFHYI